MAPEESWEVSLVDPSPALRETVTALAEQVGASDGVSPLNEQARRILAGQLDGLHLVATEDGEVVGYAQVDPADRSAQLFVVPGARRRGIGRALAELASHQAEGLEWWSFGTLPGARALAGRMGLEPVRGLLKMSKDTSATPTDDPGPAPAGITMGTFSDADVDDLVAVNALAFADHPEQGQMSRRDVEDKVAESWFDPRGVLLARDEEGRLVGFHWTKVVGDVGEVYVIGVHPFEHGRGLGRYLLSSGLAHLVNERGVREVVLYVEAANERVVQMYEKAGFVEVNRDTRWR